MRRAHSFLVLVCFLGAVALAGCGVHSYTTIEAEGATAGATGFAFDGGGAFNGVVSARPRESEPGYDIEVSFTPTGQHAPAIRDLRVGMSGTRWGHAVSVAPEAIRVHAVSCSRLGPCTQLASQAVSVEARRARPGDLDDFVLTISYIQDDEGRRIPVERQVRAHPTRSETHHYPWIFRDC